MDGTIVPCELVHTLKLGNLYKEDWHTIWERARKIMLTINEKIVKGLQLKGYGLCRLMNLEKIITPNDIETF
ncbi:SPASM domain-containing protein [Vulcanisaeta souniana]|uniref:SPASM domain-containing protein n=1 Tax=Vulcanisaeta souniana TaxID=164452 RepID=UPI001FB341DF|nr:SPASM domain-containing protein [Vulcanisaeta souniana]